VIRVDVEIDPIRLLKREWGSVFLELDPRAWEWGRKRFPENAQESHCPTILRTLCLGPLSIMLLSKLRSPR